MSTLEPVTLALKTWVPFRRDALMVAFVTLLPRSVLFSMRESVTLLKPSTVLLVMVDGSTKARVRNEFLMTENNTVLLNMLVLSIVLF